MCRVLSVAEVLDVPVVRSAVPELLTPAASAQRTVRWVHTSEIYDIGPLLKGGELLLTTGLGLVGQPTERLRRYVDSLADRGVAGVCLELGRTFDEVPRPLLERATERGIALVALHAVVPFVAVTQAVHELLMGGELQSLRRSERLSDRLLRGILDGAGLEALLAEVAIAVEAPVRLVDGSGSVLAQTAGEVGSSGCVVDVVVGGGVRGRLSCGAGGENQRSLLARAAGILGVYLVRTTAVTGSRAVARRALVRALVAGGPPDSTTVQEAAARLGLTPGRGRELVACAVEVAQGDLAACVVPVEEAARREFGSAVAGDVSDAVLVVVPSPPQRPADPVGVGRRLAEALTAPVGRAGSGRVRSVVVAEPAATLEALRERVDDVRAAVTLVPQAGNPGAGTDRPLVVRSRDLALQRLLAVGLDGPATGRFIDSQLGPVLDHDAQQRRGLLPTLEAFLACGGNKLTTAAGLGIQRQTLYDRLARLEELLAVDLGDPVARTGLHVAVIAWRLRAGAAGFGGRRGTRPDPRGR